MIYSNFFSSKIHVDNFQGKIFDIFLIFVQNIDCGYTLEPTRRNFFSSKIDNFQGKIFDIFLIFVQNIDCGYTLEAVLTSTHNLCFGAKRRKIGIPLHTPVLLYKSGV